MGRTNIPISFVKDRGNRVRDISTSSRQISYTLEQVYNALEDDNIDETSVIQRYFRDCTYPDASNMCWEQCLDLLNECADQPYYNGLFREVREDIIPNCTNEKLHRIGEKVDSLSIPDQDKATLKTIVEWCEDADRVVGNKDKINNRFNLESFAHRIGASKTSPVVNREDVYKELAELIDTYEMPIRKKVAVAMETAIYLSGSVGINENADAVSNILEYYLSSYPVIPDRDKNNIIHTLEYNKFIKDTDLQDVDYMFDCKDKSFCEKILEASERDSASKQVKDFLVKVANCKTAAAAKGIVKEAFRIIFASFILATVITWSEVVLILFAVFGLIVIVALTPSAFIASIKRELAASDKALKELQATRDQVKRYNKLHKTVKNLCGELSSGDALSESAKLVDNMLAIDGIDAPLLKSDKKNDTIFDVINYKVVSESEEFADSEDVKDLIKQYKADRDKDLGFFKKKLTKIFSKKPEHIIDDVPDILSFIRNFFILAQIGIPVIGPALAIVGFIANQFIQHKYRREEAERVLKYFKAEKEKMEKKLDKAKSEEKKDDIDAYIKCLDKCIDKLETYRDELYTDSEMDAKYEEEYNEASISLMNKITMDEFIGSGKLEQLYQAVERAVQCIRNEIVRNPNVGCSYTEYEYKEKPISSSVREITPTEILSFYLTPDGIIDVPVGKISYCNGDESYANSIAICQAANRYIDSKDFVITSYKMDGYIAVTVNSFVCISTNNNFPSSDFTMTESALNMVSEFQLNADILERMIECGIETMAEDLCSVVDVLVEEDPESLCAVINASGIDCDSFIDCLKKYQITNYYTDNCEYCNADKIANKLCCNNPDDYSDYDQLQSIYQLEAVELLSEIITEAKKKQNILNKAKDKVTSTASNAKDKVTSAAGTVKDKTGSVVDKAKNKYDELNKKRLAKDKERVSIGTTAKLGAAAAANKAKDAASKEKEVSKTIDAYSNSIIKHCKEALVSNRREAIIKGSIIPSFSKMIKGGIAVGAIAMFNPAVAAITAIGALAMSKHLTHKERQMLLDEINVEIEVVDKQLESVGDDPKKHRSLLMYKRKLERESQRIRYGLKVQGKDVPDPNL